MPSGDRYVQTLGEFAEVLRTPKTARELSQIARCSKPTVYARISALEARRVPIVRQYVRAGATGPLAIAYSIEPTWFDAASAEDR